MISQKPTTRNTCFIKVSRQRPNDNTLVLKGGRTPGKLVLASTHLESI